jgi:hypothetical protein
VPTLIHAKLIRANAPPNIQKLSKTETHQTNTKQKHITKHLNQYLKEA